MTARTLVPMLLALTTFGCSAGQHMMGPDASARASVAREAAGASAPGAVYTMTNAAAGNAVVAYARSADGTLGASRTFATGGNGTGAGLGNQGALALGDGARWLFVVNAGSNDVSVFRTGPDGLELTDRAASGGTMPVSVTAFHDLVFVLNSGGTGGIQGFRVSNDGRLSPVAGSARPLSSSAAGAAQIGFSPDGGSLVVSEKATNMLSVYHVAADGSVAGPYAMDSSGPTPFGFGFDRTGTLVVSEAFGGGAGASAVSSYRVGRDGSIALVSGSVRTDQTAACWIAVQGDGRFAYTANAGSANVVGYAVGNDGALTRLSGTPAGTAAGPTDMTFDAGSRHLYVLSPRSTAINAYAVAADGSLTSLGALAATPAGVNGLVAR